MTLQSDSPLPTGTPRRQQPEKKKKVTCGTQVAPGLRAPGGAAFVLHRSRAVLAQLAPDPGSTPHALLRHGILHEASRRARWALSTRPRAERNPGWGGDGERGGRPHGQRAVRRVPGLGTVQQRRSTRGAVQRAEAPLLRDDLRGQELPHVWREWFPPPASQEPELPRCSPIFASHPPRVSLFSALSDVTPPCCAVLMASLCPCYLFTWGEFRRNLLAQGTAPGERLSCLAAYLFAYFLLRM